MKLFTEYLSGSCGSYEFHQVVEACDEYNIDIVKLIDKVLEEEIAKEDDPDRHNLLVNIYSESMFGNILSGIGSAVGKGVNAFSQGYQQGRYGGAAGQTYGIPQQQIDAINKAWELLSNAGLSDVFFDTFQSVAGQMAQQAQQQAQQQQQGQQGQQNDMMSRLNQWQRKQASAGNWQQSGLPQPQMISHYDPSEIGEKLQEGRMHSFTEFLQLKSAKNLVEDICAGMIDCGIGDPEGFLADWLAKEHGVEVAELYLEQNPFGDTPGRLKNIWGGIKGAGQAAAGAGMAAGGGGLGGLGGGMVGGVKGIFGRSDDPSSIWTAPGGAKAGSAPGRSWMGKGIDAIKGAWGGRHDASLRSAYDNAQAAVDKFITVVSRHPQLQGNQTLMNSLQKVSDYLQGKGKEVKKAMSGAAPGDTATGAASAIS